MPVDGGVQCSRGQRSALGDGDLVADASDSVLELPNGCLCCAVRGDLPRVVMEPLLTGVFEEQPHIVHSASRDLLAMFERDPACFSPLEPLLFFKGFLALTTYRVSHQLWQDGRRWLALYFQSVASEAFSVDIHPAARIGCGILLDHAT